MGRGLRAAMAVAVFAGIGAAPSLAGHRDPFDVRCKVVGSELRISASDAGTADLVRDGERIVLEDLLGPVDCKGPVPTVTSIDLITVDNFVLFFLDLSEGPFAPGLTSEADGTSEIEIKATDVVAGVDIRLGPEANHVTTGKVGEVRSGINLNAADESSTSADPDLIGTAGFFSTGDTVLGLVFGGGGDDFMTATGGPGFSGPYPTPTAFLGGAGDDYLVGSDAGRRIRNFLVGDGGDDRLRGGPARDVLVTGGGTDELHAGRGRDVVVSRAGGVDSGDCGPGRDTAIGDDSDEIQNCEREAALPTPNARAFLSSR
jgi:hypothetical protein